MPAHCVIRHARSVEDRPAEDRAAEDRFAAGHLGELTQIVPFEMVDAALEETRTVQQRLRLLPSRVVVYLLLAGCLFPEVGYPGVWRKLTAALGRLQLARPTAGALAQARRRIGPAPLRWLFDLLRGPVGADPHRRGVWWKNHLVCAIDGTILTVAETASVQTRYTRQRGNHGGTGYPQVRLLALVACGTRAVIDAVFAPTTTGETTLVPELVDSMSEPMLVLADRNFDAQHVLARIIEVGADFLIRAKSVRHLPVLARHRDGSFTSQIAGMKIRVIDAEITITTDAGQQRGSYRLLTSLHDPCRYRAEELLRLYHQRWEIETSFLELKSSMLGGRVLRARTASGIDQEIYALLVTYQLLRTVISDATSVSGTDPDRGSFTIAWQAARDQVILAQHTIAATVIDLVGTIGTSLLAALLPPRRLRVSPRIVKRAISKYQARGPVIDRTCYNARLDIEILNGEPP